MQYLTGVSNKDVRKVAHVENIGLLAQPKSGYNQQISAFPTWAADNGCYVNPSWSPEKKLQHKFDGVAYIDWLCSVKQYQSTCLFATAPDVVGDAAATLKRSKHYLRIIRSLGFPVAYVAQDGFQKTNVPWDEFDVLFLGGTDIFKLHHTTYDIVQDAKQRGKKVHAGRVNSFLRYQLMWRWGCNTADGTYIAFAPDGNLRNVLGWLAAIRREEDPSIPHQQRLIAPY